MAARVQPRKGEPCRERKSTGKDQGRASCEGGRLFLALALFPRPFPPFSTWLFLELCNPGVKSEFAVLRVTCVCKTSSC